MTTDLLVTLAVVAVHGLALIGLLLTERRQPTATLAWVFAIVFLPVVGLLCYLLFGATRHHRVAKKTARAAGQVEEMLCCAGLSGMALSASGAAAGAGPGAVDLRTEALIRLAAKVSSRPASLGNQVEILVDGAATYEAMVRAIEEARDHVHVLFYIVQPDETGRELRDRLAAKAAAGVDVRVLVDAVGSMALPNDFFRTVEDAGGRAAFFQPVHRLFFRYRWRDRVDFRNHRKIVVTDGRIGFTGGINVGREYLGLEPAMGQWRDTHLRIEGPAALALQQVFAGDWLMASGELLSDTRFFPEPCATVAGESLVQVVDSGPDFAWSPISHILTQSIALARRRVWITNPYFIPGLPMRHALVTAALSGVDVRLLLPAKSDSFIVGLASRSYFAELLEAGARLFLYERGFIHAKTMVVDDWVSTIGSANLDMRSFYLNFELNALVFGPEMAARMGEQFERDLGHATELTLKGEQGLSWPRRLLFGGARLLSPLL